jgi:site-specific DNA-methyltransferase (adenine-specific)
MKKIPDALIDLIICDLPYGCLTGGGGQEKAKRLAAGSSDSVAGCAWDVKIDLEAFWKQVKRIRKSDKTPCIHFCNTKFGIDLILSNRDEFRYDLVWSKSNAVGFLTANKKPMASHEMIYVFSKAGSYYERIDIEGDFPAGGGGRSSVSFLPIADMPNTSTTVAGKRCVKSVIEIANKKIKGGHPTQKPEALYRWLIDRYCPPGGTVLDPTFGSGTSVFTAFSTGRNAIGIEKDETFFKKADEKLKALQPEVPKAPEVANRVCSAKAPKKRIILKLKRSPTEVLEVAPSSE